MFGPEQFVWLGRAQELVNRHAAPDDARLFESYVNRLGGAARGMYAHQIYVLLYSLLARSEADSPAEVQGGFLAIDQPFSAHKAIGQVLLSATADILVVDPYLSVEAIWEFATLAAESVTVRMLMDGRRASLSAGIAAAVPRWTQQFGTARPLEVRQAERLHDRLLVIDGKDEWIVTQSLKDLAKTTPASIQRSDAEIGVEKIAFYERCWAEAHGIT